MIEANELRIGNWYDHFGEYKQATANTILEVWEAKREWVKPIPLTPEILEKCGFEKGIELADFDGYYNYYQLGNVSGNFYSVRREFRPEWGKFATIKHLHQLQNLYYTLTGKELNPTL